jgi:hypothetical protein
MNALGDQPSAQNEQSPKQFAEHLVNAIGLNPNDLRTNKEVGQGLIEEKLKSW